VASLVTLAVQVAFRKLALAILAGVGSVWALQALA
jgi:hypothetical protein